MTAPISPAPVDQRARDDIREQLDRTVFVTAGAGTGKTSALVGRVAQLVANDTPLRNIAAITFTDAAAAELRGRLRHRLVADEREGKVAPGTVHDLDDAAICTLHAFAQRMLSQYPIEAGLPPAFEVLDEIESTMELHDRFGVFLDELLARPDLEPLWMRAFALDFKLERLEELAEALHDHRDRLPTQPLTIPPAPSLDPAPLIAAIDAALAHAGHCTDPTDNLLVRLTGEGSFASARARLAEAGDDEPAVLAVLTAGPPRTDGGGQTAWGGKEGKDVVASAMKAAAATWNELLAATRTHLATVFIEEVRRFTHESAAARLTNGRLVFHDLLVQARDLLRQHPEVRDQLAARWTHLLIDEFQDTDPLQLEIAVRLAADPASGNPSSDPIESLELQPGRLFFVGDAKQSIYRFRRADVTAFMRILDTFEADEVRLTTNFRSVPGVIEWVNEIFEHLLVDQHGQAPHQALDAFRQPTADGPRVHVVGEQHEGVKTAEVRTQEAADVATIISGAIGSWPVAGQDGERRPADRSDVAVLIPSRSALPHLEAAFVAAGLPYRVESASLVWGTQVVRDLLAVLRAIDQPGSEIDVVGALRTSVLACSDQDLLDWHEARGRWRLHAPDPAGVDADHPVARAMAQLRALARGHWFRGVSDLADRVTHDLPFFELALADDKARDHWRRLRFVLEQARAFDERPDATLRRFLQWAELQASDHARVREPALPESDHQAIRIMTIHGAKGLEFPVTVVCGLNVAPSTSAATQVVWEGDHFRARLGAPFPMDGFAEASDADKELAKLERARLLYVATTRARDHLVLSLHRPSRTTTDADMLEEAWRQADPGQTLAEVLEGADPAPGPDNGVATGDGGEPATPPASRTPGTAGDEVDRWRAEQAAWVDARAELLTRTRRAPVVAATAVAHVDDEAEAPLGSPVQRLGRAGTAIGRAVHAVLQTIDLADPSNVEELAIRHADNERVADHATGIARMVRAAIASDVVATAVAHRHWRELYVAAPLGGVAPRDEVVAEGFVDLLYEDDGGRLVIVDYKTDRLAGHDADGLVARYRLQLATYAVALEATTGKEVAGAALLFVAGTEARTEWIAGLREAMDEVRSIVSSSIRPSSHPGG
ncbi:MAG TPA: UvrD-helicase domain-containing protein [Acidimicrobiales bacterium]|nr:UvrD-helicase domain-containing protein [Acidimicrobiales bacterium]